MAEISFAQSESSTHGKSLNFSKFNESLCFKHLYDLQGALFCGLDSNLLFFLTVFIAMGAEGA